MKSIVPLVTVFPVSVFARARASAAETVMAERLDEAAMDEMSKVPAMGSMGSSKRNKATVSFDTKGALPLFISSVMTVEM